MKLSIVLPAFNEAENLKTLPVELMPYLRDLKLPFEILVVNDGSSDDTVAVAEGLHISELRLINHETNRGLGAAIKTAIREATGELLIILDTDMTFHPRYIKDLLARFNQGDVDIVIGSPKLAVMAADIQWYRRFISKAANIVYSLLFGQGINSVTTIFRLYRTADLKDLNIIADKFDINVEILFKLVQRGKKVAEVPADLTVRKLGESKLRYYREIFRHLKIILRIIVWKWRNFFTSND